MAIIDDALKFGSGLRTKLAGAIAPSGAASTPLPTIDPTMGGASPPPPPPQGLRATGPQVQGGAGAPGPSINPNSPTGSTFNSAPAAVESDGLAGRIGSRVARFGASPIGTLSRGAGLVGGGLATEAATSALTSGATPTEVYNNRLGLNTNPGFEDSTSGRLGQLAQDVGVRTAGTLSDFGSNVLDLGTSAVNGLRRFAGDTTPNGPNFNDRLRAGDGANPAVTTPQPITAPQPTPATSAGSATPNSFPTTPDLGLGAGSPGASPAPSINDQSALPQGVTKTIGANGVPQYGNVAPGSPAAPGGGVDLAGANAIEARANAIRASTLNTSDPNALFQNTNGVASTIGSTPYGGNIVPRQTVTPGGGIGGLITQKFANRGRALDIEQQHVIGDQALHGQDLGLRRQQLGFDNQFRSATLGHTIDHDTATVGIQRDQLQREGLRDASTDRFHAGELQNTRDRNAAEMARFGADYGLRARADTRAETSENQRIRDDGTDKYNKLVSQQLPVGPDGKPDQGAANFHTAAANQAVGDRIAALQAHLKTNQGDTAAQGDLQALQTKGLGALDDGERSKLFAGSEFARLANDTGTGSLNPFGSTNVQSRAPATSLTKIPRLSGDVYRDQLGREVPARYIENVGGARFNATRNRQFDPLLPGGQ